MRTKTNLGPLKPGHTSTSRAVVLRCLSFDIWFWNDNKFVDVRVSESIMASETALVSERMGTPCMDFSG